MTLALIALHFLLAMLTNCVLAWTLTKLWAWFCAVSLGAGPTIGAWWGIALIIGLIINANTFHLARDERKDQDTWAKPVALVLGCLVLLGFAWVFGTILGWRA